MHRHLYIQWNDYNSLGIPIIDEQHRGIVSIINSLHYFTREGTALESLGPTINAMDYLAVLHFKTEETLFTNSAFPGHAEHIQAHRKFSQQVSAVLQEAKSSGDAQLALVFLKKWWIDHINVEDKKYAPYIKA